MKNNSKNKALWDDVNKRVAEWEARHKVSPQPSKLGFMHILLSELAPHFYSQKELAQIKNFHRLVKPAIARMKKKNMKKQKNVTPKERILIQEQYSDVGENDIPLPAKKKYSRNYTINVSDSDHNKPAPSTPEILPVLDDTSNQFADLNIGGEKDLESKSDILPEAEKEAVYEKEDWFTRTFWRWGSPPSP